MGGDEADTIAQAVKRTADSGTARFSLEAVSDLAPLLATPQPQPARRPGLRGVFTHVLDKGFDLWIKHMMKSVGQLRRAEGFLDFPARRCAVDHGAYAELVQGSSQWSGRSGRAIATIPEEPAHALSPLWLFDLLRGVTEAGEVGTDQVRGQRCRRLRATVDLARVADAVPDNTPLPPGVCFEELGALPLDLWLDEEGYVRRVRFQYSLVGRDSQTYSLELFDFGTRDKVDWSRLPLLKDPRTGAVIPAAVGRPSAQ